MGAAPDLSVDNASPEMPGWPTAPDAADPGVPAPPSGAPPSAPARTNRETVECPRASRRP
ncbi:MAG: hypothetical protein AMS21_06110 [Gemmatimonas sp. SG8_38_2]|nr:MAG: hypothetical protein AMS21_06110 [Gemmatimonas sp. SG8_38_2]